MKKQRNIHVLIDRDTSPSKLLSSNKVSKLIHGKHKSIFCAITMKIRRPMEEQFNQLKDQLIKHIKELVV